MPRLHTRSIAAPHACAPPFLRAHRWSGSLLKNVLPGRFSGSVASRPRKIPAHGARILRDAVPASPISLLFQQAASRRATRRRRPSARRNRGVFPAARSSRAPVARRRAASSTSWASGSRSGRTRCATADPRTPRTGRESATAVPTRPPRGERRRVPRWKAPKRRQRAAMTTVDACSRALASGSRSSDVRGKYWFRRTATEVGRP